MTPITQIQYDLIKSSSTAAQSIFKSLRIIGWPTIIRHPDNTYYLKHP